jgi:leucyl/phenylalanyl-tRNA--protein transferase
MSNRAGSPRITPEMLLRAYAIGIFPMAESRHDPHLYWIDPDARGILPLDDFHIPRSLKKTVLKGPFQVTADRAFEDVVAGCAEPAPGRRQSWINDTIFDLCRKLHVMGYAHSVETWLDGELVGGLYGVALGGAFFGESMFSRETDASKVALVHLVARLNAGGFRLLDAQFMNPHLKTLGAIVISKADYKELLPSALVAPADFHRFTQDDDPACVLELAGSG